MNGGGRVAISRAEFNLTLSDITELVVQRRSIWPVSSEVKGTNGKGRVDKRGQTPHHENATSIY